MSVEYIPDVIPLTRQNGYYEGERACISCEVPLPRDAMPYVTQCKDCFLDEDTKRACTECKLKRIPLAEPDWRKVCGTCYSTAKKRPCVCCGDLAIPEYDPAWRLCCGPCFKDPNNYRACAECKENKVKPGTPDTTDTCGPCRQKAFRQQMSNEKVARKKRIAEAGKKRRRTKEN